MVRPGFYTVYLYETTTMAHKKAAGSAKNLRDSKPKYRWVKIFGGQPAVAGNIIIRQKGDKFHAGENTYKSSDFSIHALIDGVVTFKKKNITRFDGRKYLKTVVEVSTEEQVLITKEAAKKPTAKKEAAPKAEKAPTKEKKASVAKKEIAPKAEKKPAAKKEAAPKAEKKPAAKKPTTKKEA